MKYISQITLIIMLFITCSASNAQEGKTFERNLLIEEFTTEKCGYCPAASLRIERAVEECDAPEKVIIVCHHVGYGTDWLTVPNASNALLWFYQGTSYAPAIMWNRTKVTGKVPVMEVSESIPEIKEMINKKLAESSPVSISTVGSTFNKTTRELKIKVSGEFGETLDGNIMLNVYLSEDSIQAHRQSMEIPPPSSTWIHKNVLRYSFTPEWGDPIEDPTEGTIFEKSYSTIIPDKYSEGEKDVNINLDKLKLIVFVSRYDAENRNNCQVFNAKQDIVTNLLSIVELHGYSTSGLDNIEYDLEGAGLYPPAANVTVRASATHNGKQLPFIYWGDANGTILSNDNPYTFETTSLHVLYAYFGKLNTANDINTTPVIIYPNPAKDAINISGTYKELHIIDVTGKTVIKTEQTDKIDITALKSGIYTILTFGNNAVKTEKLIISR